MRTDSVTLQMQELLDEYSEEVQEVTTEAIEETAAESVTRLRNNSPKASGRYARGWTSKADGPLGRIVYNKTDWQLTHLLENGHVVANQFGNYGHPNGRVAGIKHIAPVEEWAADELPIRISRGLS